MVAKNFGEIPAAGPLEPVDEEVRATVLAGFDAVGGLLERHRQKAAIAEAMRVVGEVNAYVSRTEPFKLKGDDQRERLGDGAAHPGAVRLRPQHDAGAVPAARGQPGRRGARRRAASSCRCRASRRSTGLDDGDDGRTYPVITGDYSATPRWESRPVVVGTPISKPAPVFTKLDESVVDEELARAAGA